MRLSTILLLTTLLNVSASVYSQNVKLTFKLEDVTVKEVLAEIEKNSNYRFLYRNELIDVDQKVNINAADESIDAVLTKLFDSNTMAYRIFEGNIVVITNKNLQQIKVTGTVTDANTGDHLPGVNILVQGTTTGVISDVNGNYSIEVPDANSVLIFSFVGYVNETVPIEGKSVIDVKLVPDIKQLDEVIVVGYGTQRKSDITGSVTSVPKARLSQIPMTNFAQALEGAVAGVNITQLSSIPGTSPTTSIRGINSINANTTPFMVVDGIPFSGSFNDINPNDVASIEILKDASAVAIYGTRGANGVILITTKKGNSGKPTIRYSGYGGYENFAHILKPMDGPAYAQKWAVYNAQKGLTPQYPVPNLAELANYNAGITTDWVKEASQQGTVQDHNLSISGGTNDIKYYVSGDYFKNKGIIKGYQYQRAALHSNIDVNVTNYLSIGASTLISFNNFDGGRANLLNATAMSPYASVKDAFGKYIIYPMAPEQLFANPLLGLVTDRTDRNTNLSGNVYAELTPTFLKGLKYRVNASYTYIPARNANYTGRLANNLIGGATSLNSEDKIWVVENILSYSKDFNKHHVDFTGLYSAQEENYFVSAFGGSNYINDILSFNNIGAGGTVNAGSIPDPNSPGNNVNATGTYAYRSAILSQMGRINYSYDSRYLLTLTARRDGYSAFGEGGDKYGIFPSFALGWNVNKESFLRDISFINNLKLRFSYGKVGNQAVGVNATNSTEGAVKYPFNGVVYTGVQTNVLGNPNLHWESTTSSNIGLDFSGWNNRVNLTVEVYKTNTKDLLMRRNIPQITGYTRIWDNIGEMGNTGIELTLNSVNLKLADFKWESNINFSSNKNEIIDLYGDKTDDRSNRWFIGQPRNVIYDYKMIGIWQEGENTASDPTAKPGDIKFQDISGPNGIPDGVIDGTYDRVVQGQTDPKWRGGMTNTFTYKNLHLSIFIQTAQGILKNNSDFSYADEAYRRNMPADVEYWTSANKSQTRPSLVYTNTRGYGYPNDGSYTRIKDVTLSYVFPRAILEKIKLQGLTIYASGKNLYTFTKWIGWDPQSTQTTRGVINASGNWNDNYPFTRQIVVGLNVALK